MPRLPISEDQIKAVLSELTTGRTVREVSREHGVSPNTLYRWRAKFTNGQQPNDSVRLHSLEAENRRLKKEFAELTLDYATLRAALIRDVMGDC
ncbi:MAG: transposase [Nitrospira sp.]|nr:transposase [Nitrospira sp.]